MRGGPTPPPLGEPVPPPDVLVEEPPRRRPPFPPDRELWPWLLLLLVLALAGLGVGLWLAMRDDDKKQSASTTVAAQTVLVTQTTPTRPAVATVSVPKVAGLPQADAVRQLRSFGFKTAIQEQASSRPPGTVVGQNPAAGAKVARGATVILAVSQKAAGPATTSAKAPAATKVVVPNVLGIDSGAAARRLRAAGLQPALRPVRSTKPPGAVTAQAPGPGSQVAKGAQVVLQVSQRPAATTTAATTTAATATTTTPSASVVVPDVVGQQRQAGQAALRNAGLVSEVKGVPSAEPEGTVVSQAPKAGATLKRGEHVLINVANGQKPGEGSGASTTVPDVVGKTRADAQQALRGAGLVTEVKGVPSNEAEGTVVAQEPRGNTSAKRGAHVLINVANGQKPQ